MKGLIQKSGYIKQGSGGGHAFRFQKRIEE